MIPGESPIVPPPTKRNRHRNRPHVYESSDLPAHRIRRHAGKAMAQPVLAQFGRVDDRALWRSSTQVRWTREMATARFRREPSFDAPGRAPPPRLRTLPTHVVHQHLRRVHAHRPHWLRGSILRRNRDRWHDILCISVPNTSFDRPSQSMEEFSTTNRLLYRLLRKDNFTDPPDVEPDHPATPSPIFTTNPIRGCAGAKT